MMLDWIQRRRTTPSTGYPGIFPSGKGSDWPDVAQFWTFTDSYNVKAVKSMAEMLDQYGRDAVEAIIRAEYNRCRCENTLCPATAYSGYITIKRQDVSE